MTKKKKKLFFKLIFLKELVRQGEQLDNINKKLDDVDQTLTATQKNINQIKSIFGGFKNKFMGKSSSTNLIKEDAKKKPMPTSSSSNSFQNQNRAENVAITGSDREKEIYKNLDEMSSGLTHLNSLAKAMTFELDRQDPLIGNITAKSERTHAKIDSQNDQMKRIK